MKSKCFTIGLFGAQIESINLGCQALTFSLLNLLQTIADENAYRFVYKVFERFPNLEKFSRVEDLLNIPGDRLFSVKSTRFIRVLNIRENNKCVNEIKSCDLIIDITLGDSFSDIYGFRRFISYTVDKLMVEKCKVPLILGPQTYGPYQSKVVRLIARKAIKGSYSVFSRDIESTKCIKKLGVKKNVYTGTDLAFSLPYDKNLEKFPGRNVGINISGMLWPKRYDNQQLESGVEMCFQCDYKQFMLKIIDKFGKLGYKVHLIPHVYKDVPAITEIYRQFPYITISPEFFDDPISAKNYISRMDLFIGARMHSTIAAVSSGVPTIPVSYSRKFQGLFRTLQYEYCVDLHSFSTNDAVDYVMNIERNLDEIKKKVGQSKCIAKDISQKMKTELEKELASILDKQLL